MSPRSATANGTHINTPARRNDQALYVQHARRAAALRLASWKCRCHFAGMFKHGSSLPAHSQAYPYVNSLTPSQVRWHAARRQVPCRWHACCCWHTQMPTQFISPMARARPPPRQYGAQQIGERSHVTVIKRCRHAYSSTDQQHCCAPYECCNIHHQYH